jgi:hypothetical protein
VNTKERTWTNLLINKTFQLKVIGCLTSLFLFSTLCFYSATYLFFWNLKSKGLKVGIPEGHLFYQFLLEEKHEIDVFFLCMALFNFALLLSVLIIITHRIAGPINKIKTFLQNPRTEEDFHLRESDFFQELKPLVDKFKDQNNQNN